MNTINLEKEKNLLARAQSNPDSFADLYQYYLEDVYRFCVSILKNQHDAEDITSQTFIEFYKYLPKFEWQGISPKFWLFRTAKFICFNKFNKKNMENMDDETLNMLPSDNISVEEIALDRNDLSIVMEEINKLKPSEREVINLRVWENMQFDEISSILDENISTVKKRFYRAVEKLKVSLEAKDLRKYLSLSLVLGCIVNIKSIGEFKLSAHAASNIAESINNSIINTTMATTTGLAASVKTFVSTHTLSTLIATTATVATIAGGYAFYNNYQSQNNKPNKVIVENDKVEPTSTVITTITQTITPTNTPTAEPTSAQVTYQRRIFNQRVGFHAGTGNGQLSVEIPSDWNLLRTTGNDGCYVYTATKGNSKLSINDICNSYSGTYTSLPSQYTVVRKTTNAADDGSDVYLIRFLNNQKKIYEYANILVAPGSQIKPTDKKVDGISISEINKAIDGRIFARVNLSTSNQEDLIAADRIITSLYLQNSVLN